MLSTSSVLIFIALRLESEAALDASLISCNQNKTVFLEIFLHEEMTALREILFDSA